MGCCISSSTAVETLSVVNNKNKNEAPPSKPKTSRAKSMPSRGSVQLSSPEELFPSAGTSSTAIKQIKFNQKNLLSVDIPGHRPVLGRSATSLSAMSHSSDHSQNHQPPAHLMHRHASQQANLLGIPQSRSRHENSNDLELDRPGSSESGISNSTSHSFDRASMSFGDPSIITPHMSQYASPAVSLGPSPAMSRVNSSDITAATDYKRTMNQQALSNRLLAVPLKPLVIDRQTSNTSTIARAGSLLPPISRVKTYSSDISDAASDTSALSNPSTYAQPGTPPDAGALNIADHTTSLSKPTPLLRPFSSTG